MIRIDTDILAVPVFPCNLSPISWSFNEPIGRLSPASYQVEVYVSNVLDGTASIVVTPTPVPVATDIGAWFLAGLVLLAGHLGLTKWQSEIVRGE
jgi:hypothetical protein